MAQRERLLDIAAAPSADGESSGTPVSNAARSVRAEVCVSLLMFAGGSLTSFFGGAVYVLCPGDTSLVGAPRLLHQAWLSFLMTAGTFATNALLCSAQPDNWHALKQQLTGKLAARLLVPSALDVLITGAATVSLSLAPPSLASMLKTSMQLLSIAVISRVVQGKSQSWQAIAALFMVAAGVGVVISADLFWRGVETKESTTMLEQAVGIVLALGAGHLGAWRNIIEEAILKDMGLPSSTLLMCESILSAIAMGLVAPVLLAVTRDDMGDSRKALTDTLASPLAASCLALFWLTAYVKDAGKFWLLKHASPLRQKVVAIAFPFGTWAVGLLVFYGFGGDNFVPFLGARWSTPSSEVKLLGFVMILAANMAFLLFKSGYTFTQFRDHAIFCAEEEDPPDLSWVPKGRSYSEGPAPEVHTMPGGASMSAMDGGGAGARDTPASSED